MVPSRPLTIATCPVHADTVALLERRSRVEVCQHSPSADELRTRAAGATALLAFMPDRIDAGILDACPKLRIVAGAFKGQDNVDVDACTARGVWVSVVPDLLSGPTAELAVGLILNLARRIGEGDSVVRSGGFAGWRPRLFGIALEGTSVGIVGLGSLGQAIASRLRGFDCRLAYSDPGVSAAARLISRPLEGLLRESEIVVLAAPLTSATHGLINAETLELMRPGAVLVNVGRGSTVDEDAVAAALDSGRLSGYGADVFAFEDWPVAQRPATIPPALLRHPRTVFTPHVGSAIGRVRRAVELQAAESILQALDGERPQRAINAP